MTDYALKCYWNKKWLPKSSSTSSSIEYPLEHSLQVLSGTPTSAHNLWVPSSPTPAQVWQPVLMPGVWPADPGAPGFQPGDTIYFQFQVAGGNDTSSPDSLDHATITFMRKAPLQGSGTNPIGITNPPKPHVIKLGEQAYNKYEFVCDEMPTKHDVNQPIYAQLFQAEVSGQDTTEFTFSGGNFTWVLAIEAVYGSGTSEQSFTFDPEWIVGTGG